MKKLILFTLTAFVVGLEANSQTTFTTAASGSQTVSNAAQWLAAFPNTVGSGLPYTFVIASSYSLRVGPNGNNTVDLTSPAATYSMCTINVNGKLGFYTGNVLLDVAPTSTINIASGGEIGYFDAALSPQCCIGNASTQIQQGATTYTAPFNFDGPQSGFSGSPLSNSTYWSGGASTTNWNTPGNWSNGVPTSTINAIITNVPFQPTIPAASTYSVSRLVVQPSATVTITGAVSPAAGGALVLNSALINDGTVIVKSGGSLVQTAASTAVAGTGTCRVESTIPGGVQFIGSPINNIAAGGFGITPTGANGGQIVPQPACSPTAIATGSPYGNLLEIHENPTVLSNCAQSLWFVKSSGALENGRGYSLANAAATLIYTGTVNNGSVSYNALTRQAGTINQQDGSTTTTRGWHLVSNPYPSPITITAAMLTANFDEQVSLYKDMGTPYNGTWQTFSTGGGTLPVTIAVGQAFQIRNKTVGTSPNFALDNTCRVVANPTFYKLMQFDYLKVALSNGTMTDTTRIYFDPGATDNFDPSFDASRLIDGMQRPMIYSVVNNEQLSVNALPAMNANDTKTVSISVRTEVQGAHTLTFTGVTVQNATILLKDLKLNTLQPVTEGYVYNFTTVAGDNRDRFELHFAADGLGISTINNSNFKLYPNPADGTTSLFLGADHGFSSATINDVFGKTVQVYSLNGNETMKSLDLNGLSSGVYFVKLSGQDNAGVIKLIKK